MAENSVKVDNITKKYNLYEKPMDRVKEALHPKRKVYHKEFFALDDISFEMKKGESLGIVGKNGSGKSTLLKILTGVLTQTSGTVSISGKISSLLELGAGFNMDLNGIENIYMNGLIMGFSRKEMDNKKQQIIDFADIGSFINQPVKTYSSGMFVRLAFATAINVEPEILIIDEALAVGDVRFQIKCIDKMKELKEKGISIIFVSHASEQIKRFCDKAIWINEGKLIASGESSEIVDLYESFMKDNIINIKKEATTSKNFENKNEFKIPLNKDIIASITKVYMNKERFETFEELYIEVDYDIYVEKIDGFLLGVAIYTPDRDYIFGPNTFLDKVKIHNDFGRHTVSYIVPKIPLLNGTYDIEVGIFNNEGLVNIDYNTSIKQFIVVNNKYISEGQFYIKHEWVVKQ